MTHCHFHIKNDLPELTTFQLQLDAFFDKHQLCTELAGEMMLVAEELLVNIINYGHTDGLEHVIKIEFLIKQDLFSATLIDDGMAFNPLKQQLPTLGQSIEHTAIGGLGIPLILSLSDEQHYQRKGQYNVFRFERRVRQS